MTDDQKITVPGVSKIWIAAGIIFAGLAWYFSYGLTGDYWYLVWLAPVPVLLLSLRTTGKGSFFISFIAYFIGKLSWFLYLARVATLVPAIILTILLPLIFALLMLLVRKVILKGNAWWVIFAFPVFITAGEFLMINFSADGTATSLAYTQLNFLPIIQIAPLTGILGVTFMATFIPSVIALGWHFRKEKIKFRYAIGIGGAIVVLVILYGFIRINTPSDSKTIKMGIVSLDEKLHSVSEHPDFEREKTVAASYMKQVPALAAQGAKVVVMPERAIAINKNSEKDVIGLLSNIAKQYHVFIITGYTNFRNSKERNSSLVIDSAGNVLDDYNKTHLVVGLERQFTPGAQIGLFKFNGIQAATAVCKDLDFQEYIRQYGINKPAFLFIPAWDFTVDDWLHSRMAILRGVENGFSEIRSARLGRLSISDYYGRVNYEANSADGRAVTLVGEVSTQHIDTLYDRFGDWFGVLDLVVALGLVFVGFKKR